MRAYVQYTNTINPLNFDVKCAFGCLHCRVSVHMRVSVSVSVYDLRIPTQVERQATLLKIKMTQASEKIREWGMETGLNRCVCSIVCVCVCVCTRLHS